MKPSYNPKKVHRKRVHGFMTRMKSSNGRAVLARRRQKNRKRLTV